MTNDLVRVRNRETGEVLVLGRAHLERWPDDPYDVIDNAPEPSPTSAPGEVSSAYVDQSPDARP